MAVAPIPAGYEGATPYLIIKNAADAIAFYEKVFGAETTMRLNLPDGGVAHAEIKVGGGTVMLAEENTETEMNGPDTLGGTPVSMLLYYPDVDAQFNAAIAAGATVLKPLEDQFWGDRMGTLKDPFGHIWSLATHIEDVSQDEVDRRFAAMMG
jgi:PhnB protein